MYKLIIFKRWIIMMSLMMGVALTASADRIKIGDLYYTLDATDHTATVVNEIYNSEENYASLPAEVVIPEEVTSDGINYTVSSVGSYAFYFCRGLTEITIPSTVISIDFRAFCFCSQLSKITWSSGITNIGYGAFSGCESLTEITLPASLVSIDEFAFSDCYKLKSIRSFNYNIEGVVRSSLPTTATLTLIYNQENVADLSTSNMIEYFKNVRIELDEGMYAWVTIPELINIATERRVDSLHTLVPLGNESVVKTEDVDVLFVGLGGRDIVDDVYSTSGFNFTPSENKAENEFTVAIASNENTKCITLTSAGTLIEKIGMNKIENVEYLKVTGDINGTDVLTINRMTSLITLDLSEANIVEGGVTYRDNYKTQNNVVGSYFISGIELKYLKLPVSATMIDESAFKYLPLLGVEIGNSVTSIGSEAFFWCLYLVEITIPSSVTTIGYRAFNKCQSLREITIPSSVTTINSYAFGGCDRLTALTIEDGESVLMLSSSPFYNTPLEKLYLGRNLKYDSGVLGKSAPFYNMTKLNDVTIGHYVTSVGDFAFCGCTELTNIPISNSIVEIGNSAFRDCKNLQSIKLPQTLREIHNYTFSGCSALKSIVIPEKVHTIGAYAFSGTAISEVQLPDSVASVGEGAFKGCANIRKVYSLNATPPAIASSTFDYTTQSNAPLYVRKGSLVYYWLDPEWKNFLEISDDLICLNAIPDARYGDGEIDLNEYNPDGLDLVYESSNIEVVQIEGSKMRIVGAGSATIGARTVGEGTSMELMNKMRQLNVLKADLTVGVADITINEGEALPEFTYTFSGLQYSDTPDDIEELPVAMCEVTPASPAGEYKVTYTPGRDRNYAISTLPAKVTVVNNSGIEDINADADADEVVEVFNLNGVCVFQGPRSEANLTKGLYIIRQGNIVAKVLVR